MARGFQGAMLRGFGARDHTATVIETVSIAPHFVRIRMESPTLFQDAQAEPAAWLRFWFPDPEGSTTEFQRAYTISEADVPAGRFAVDVVLHDPAGPASLWARTVEPGATIAVMSLMGSSRFDTPDEQPAGYLLIGDSASIPGINGIIGIVPDDVPIEVYLEQHDDNDRQIPIAEHPRLRLHWVSRRDEKSLAAAIETRDWSDWYAWATPEATTLKHVRTRLRDDFGFPKSEIHAQAYWSAGRAMGIRRGDKEAAVAGDPDTVALSSDPVTAEPEVVVVQDDQPVAKGSWRAQAAGRLLAPLRSALIASGVLQAIITLVQLAPFLLLVELARLLVSGAEPSRLREIGFAAVALLGFGTLLGAAMTLWLHVVDARFASDLRSRLLSKLSRLPLGWFTARGSGSIKQLVADDTLSLHYLVTHAIPDAVARGGRTAGGAGLPVRRRLAGGPGPVRPGAGLSGVDVVDDDSVRPAHPAVATLGRADEQRGRRLSRGPAGDPCLRRRRRIEFPPPPRRIRRLPHRLAAPAGRQEDPDGSGHPPHHIPVADRRDRHPAGCRRPDEAGQPVAVPAAGHHVRRPAAQHRLRPGRNPRRVAGRPPPADHPRRSRNSRCATSLAKHPAIRRARWYSTG